MSVSSYIRVIVGIAVFIFTLLFAVIGYVVAGWDVSDAFYMVVITIFGVGYGEVQKVDTLWERLVTIMLILVGTGGALYAVSGILQTITEGQIEKVLGARRMNKNIHKLHDHTIICGFGRVGRILASDLKEQGKQFVIVDSDENRVQDAMDKKYYAMLGDATSENVLREAGIEHARCLSTVLPSDAVNVFITLTARNIKSDLQIIARAERQSTEEKLLQAGANEVVQPATLGAVRIAHMIIRPTATELLDQIAHSAHLSLALKHLGLRTEEFRLEPPCDLIGKDIAHLRDTSHGEFLIAGLYRHGQTPVSNPACTEVLERGDVIVVIGHPESLPNFREIHGLKPAELNPD